MKEDQSIIICKPDKGRGIVIIDREEYDSKMKNILSDTSKFRLLKTDITTYILKCEDKLNRLLRNVKHLIGDHAYDFIYASGTKPGYLYGLPIFTRLTILSVPLCPA